jgi:hypothetical protein
MKVGNLTFPRDIIEPDFMWSELVRRLDDTEYGVALYRRAMRRTQATVRHLFESQGLF